MQGLGVKLSWVETPVVVAPALPEHHVPRSALVALLRASRQRLSLLCAPAGYGKTVLLEESFSVAAEGEEIFWLRLGGRTLSLPELTRQLSIVLDLPSNAGGSGLLQHFSSSGRVIRLVLDDLPGELSIELNNWFEQLLNLPESRLRLSVSCRQCPGWNLPRLLLKGELLELDAARLGMTREDYENLCGRVAANVDAVERERIWSQSTGWWGGACLLLAGTGHVGRLLREYLEREVLARLGVEERELLHGLCHLPHFSDELCAQLWEGRSGALLLQRLRQQQAFVMPVEGQECWFRIHPLVAEALQGELDSSELARLRLQSCRLLSVAGHLHEAIDQALRAQQPEVAATYMERLQPTWQLAERHLPQLLDWRRQLPATLLESTPQLIYLSALTLLFSGRLGEASECLACFGRFMPAATVAENRHLLAHWMALNGALQASLGRVELAERLCREALESLERGAQDWLSRLLCYFSLERALMAGGRLEEAHAVQQEALEQARRQGCLDGEVVLQGDRLRLLMLRGELDLVELLLEDSLAARAATGLENDPLLGRLLFIKADLLLSRGQHDQAGLALSEGQRHTRDRSAPFVLLGHLGLAELASRQGDEPKAQLHLHRGERAMQYGRIDACCYRPALCLQHLRILQAHGRWRDLLGCAGRLAEEYPVGRPISTSLPPSLSYEVQLLVATAEHGLGRVSQAQARLRQLVEQCAHHGFRGVQGMARQLLDQLDGQGTKTLADSLSYQEELTSRECSVLELLAKGLSNQEIADALFLSVNTVKYHAKNINAKLGTSRRTQAIVLAKARGLLA